MKCVNCGIDNNLKERTKNQGKCKYCNHIFVFDRITTFFKLTDEFFQELITSFSIQNTIYFTQKQFFYALNRHLYQENNNRWIDFLPIPKPSPNKMDKLTINENLFQDWVNRWQQINGAITNMLPSPPQENAPANINPDITAYSFDRVVVCDSAEMAHFLIANNFHFENNCAVLSITGYPENIFSTVMGMLRRNPDLKVYALHDASPRGVTLINHLRTSPNWFLNTDVTIYDLGLLPRQFIKKSQAFIQEKEESATDATNLLIDVKQDLTEAEIAWLESGKFIELESYTPKRLLRVVTQGIAKSQQPDIQPDSGGTTFIGGYDNYDNDRSSITMFTVDTFG